MPLSQQDSCEKVYRFPTYWHQKRMIERLNTLPIGEFRKFSTQKEGDDWAVVVEFFDPVHSHPSSSLPETTPQIIIDALAQDLLRPGKEIGKFLGPLRSCFYASEQLAFSDENQRDLFINFLASNNPAWVVAVDLSSNGNEYNIEVTYGTRAGMSAHDHSVALQVLAENIAGRAHKAAGNRI